MVKRWNANPKVWGSIPRGDSEFFLYPMLVTRRKKSFLIIHRAQNLPSLLFLSNNKLYVYIWIIKVVWLLTTRIWVVFSIPARRPWCSNSSFWLFRIPTKKFWLIRDKGTGKLTPTRIDQYHPQDGSRTIFSYEETGVSHQFIRRGGSSAWTTETG